MGNTITGEEIQQITNAINDLMNVVKPVVEAIIKLFRQVKEFLIKLWLNLKHFIEKNEKIKKYLKIYNKTNNQRIKKKQITKILKLLKKNE